MNVRLRAPSHSKADESPPTCHCTDNEPYAGFRPAVDLFDDGSDVRILVELPGLEMEDIRLEFRPGFLRIGGEKRIPFAVHNRCHRERSDGKFERVVPLPDDIDTVRASAHQCQGVLTVLIPRRSHGHTDARHPE